MEIRSFFSKALSIVAYAAAVFLLLSLVTYTKVDADILAINSKVTNLAGPFGAWLADFLRCAFGYSSFLAVLFFILTGLYFAQQIKNDYYFQTAFATLILFFSTAVFLALIKPGRNVEFSGGYIGHYLSEFFLQLIGFKISLFLTIMVNGIAFLNSGFLTLASKWFSSFSKNVGTATKPQAFRSTVTASSAPMVDIPLSKHELKPPNQKKRPWIQKSQDTPSAKPTQQRVVHEAISKPAPLFKTTVHTDISPSNGRQEESAASHFDSLLDNDPEFNMSIKETLVKEPEDTIYMKDLLFDKRAKSSFYSDAISKTSSEDEANETIEESQEPAESHLAKSGILSGILQDEQSSVDVVDNYSTPSEPIRFTNMESATIQNAEKKSANESLSQNLEQASEEPEPKIADTVDEKIEITTTETPIETETNTIINADTTNNINTTPEALEEFESEAVDPSVTDDEHKQKEDEIQSVISEAAKLSQKAKLGNNDDADERVFHSFSVDEEYDIPAHFFKRSPFTDPSIWKREIQHNSELLVKTLADFGIESRVSAVHRGPVITLYEMQIAAGIKVNKVSSLSDDIAMALAASRVRIVAPIPGKSAVGVELPNKTREMVTIGDVFESNEYRNAEMQLKVGLGKDILGKVVKLDLKKQPHLLIAGATGAGKSVCVNTLISSLVYNYDPDRVRFIMVDPKMVELQLYNGLPHQLTPVITEPDVAPKALKWAIYEMERRYRLLSELHVRDIERYNQKINSYKGKSDIEPLPYIVIIVDELADLMMVAPKEMENYITRIAQKARAVGIHLVLATQRPSVDVITGIIKANFPARIAFQVAQKTDSRTIIDQNGAESLLGKGDMLYQSPMSSFPTRIQGAFISEDEIIDMVRHAQKFGHPHYIDIETEVDEREASEFSEADAEQDEVFVEALRIIEESRKASASYLQRRLSIGYNRAARIIERMEELGYVGPAQGSKPREVLI